MKLKKDVCVKESIILLTCDEYLQNNADYFSVNSILNRSNNIHLHIYLYCHIGTELAYELINNNNTFHYDDLYYSIYIIYNHTHLAIYRFIHIFIYIS